MTRQHRTGPVSGPPKMERISRIAKIMAEGKWRTRVTEIELMQEWGVKLHLVRRDAEEASRLLRFDPKELDSLRDQQQKFLERLQHDAIERKNTVTGLPDYKSALEATKMTYEYVLGVSLKASKEVDPGAMSDEELRKLAAAALTVIGTEKRANEQAAVQDPGPAGKRPADGPELVAPVGP